MSAAAPDNAGFSALGIATFARLICLILALAAFLAALGPPRRIAHKFGWRFAQGAPVLFQRLLCAGLGVRVRRYGPFSGEPRQLIVANHVSWLDIPVLGSLGPMSFFAKKELRDHALGRGLVDLQGAVYVDRQRRSCLPEVNLGMAEAMRAGTPVVLFAEATTGDGNRLLRFRSSHFEAIRQAAFGPGGRGAVIQPVYLDYARLAGLPMARCERPLVAWYGDVTFLSHLLHYARGGGVTCDVYCGSPIQVGPGLDRKTATRLTEAAVRRLAADARTRPAPPIFPERKRA